MKKKVFLLALVLVSTGFKAKAEEAHHSNQLPPLETSSNSQAEATLSWLNTSFSRPPFLPPLPTPRNYQNHSTQKPQIPQACPIDSEKNKNMEKLKDAFFETAVTNQLMMAHMIHNELHKILKNIREMKLKHVYLKNYYEGETLNQLNFTLKTMNDIKIKAGEMLEIINRRPSSQFSQSASQN